MLNLEKLYDCAERHLMVDTQNWDGFANEFEQAFGARMVLYAPTFEGDTLAWRSSSGLIATTNRTIASEYIDKKLFERNQVEDQTLNPLEPSRRTDTVNDEIFVQLDVVQDFFLPNGIFYMVAVSAILEDGSFLVLVVWRNKNEDDFTDLEMQRLALFMRYLATFLRKPSASGKAATDEELRSFGDKYSLTGTEVDILSLMLKGQSLRNIADSSERSYGTVRWHVQNILGKCQVKNQKNLLSEFYNLIRQ